MKFMHSFVMVVLLCVSQNSLAESSKCNLATMKTVLVQKIKEGINLAYREKGESFDAASLRIKAGPPFSTCIQYPTDPESDGCAVYQYFPTLFINFKSPRHTPLRLVAGSYTKDNRLGFRFEIKKTFDADGVLKERFCKVEPLDALGMGTLPAIVNPQTGAEADVSAKLPESFLEFAVKIK